MPKEVKDLIERLEKQFNLIKPLKNRKLRIIENTKMQHQESNTECGMYSLFFIITCLTRNTEPSENIMKLSTDDLIALFAGDTRIPDKYIEKYRGIYFNV
jgi:hypothetical protein